MFGSAHDIIDLLRTYDRPGPRYTSYPPAPVFSEEYDGRQFELDIVRNNRENAGPLSLYIHVPFCDTLCYFCGCTTVVTKNRAHLVRYLRALETEIEKVSGYVGRNREVIQLAWGGGTPSYLTPQQIRDLTTFLRQHFAFASDAEFSVEIDPRDLTFEHMQAFHDGGVNRISIGVQDFDERVQQAVNREQPEEITRQAVAWSRALGIESVNLDLIYGLPLQTSETFRRTLEKVVEISPERIAVFNFAYVPWMKSHQKLIRVEDMPSPEAKLRLLTNSIETLTAAGYEYIGMDHFAKQNDELTIARKQKTLHRNFQGYSTRAGADLYAFGMSAISHFGGIYAQNEKTLPAYYEAMENDRFATHVGYRMTEDDEIRKYVIMRLMCDLEVVKEEVRKRFAISFDEYFAESISQLAEYSHLGLVENNAHRITIHDAGRLLLRNIAMCFDAYLPKFQQEKKLFSRTI